MTPFLPRFRAFEWIDVVIGLLALADFCARLAISRTPWKDMAHPSTLADVAAIVSFLAPVVGEGIGFLRLLQVLLRPNKVRHPCPVCGLQRHDRDAAHCKACGTILNIPDEGAE